MTEPPISDPFDIDENLRKLVRTLMAWRGQTVEATAAGIGIGKSTMYQRLAPYSMSGKKVPPTPFSARDAWRLAQFFGVHVSVMFVPVESLIPGSDVHSGAVRTNS